MQEIRLAKMKICNFKGIRELDILFNGKDMNIRGDNGTGKTTIIDSFTWLLFGKDSLGRAEFGIKPTDDAGDVIHQIETSVEATFDISGEEKTFKKTLSEVWTRKRGAAEAEFTRNENNYYIDGVPKKKTEYTSAIKDLIEEEVFKILTNPLYFNESINWKDRRGVLLAICGEVSDEEVISLNTELAPLLSVLHGKSVSDFKDITSASMKRINHELDMIPVKINEASLAKPSVEALTVDYARKDAITQEIEELRVQKSNIENGTAVAQHRQKIQELQHQYKNIGLGFDPNSTPEAEKVVKLNAQISSHEFMIQNSEKHINILSDVLTKKKTLRQELSSDWDKIMEQRFTDSICPTCHRELPENEVEGKRKEFNIRKAQRLDDIEIQNAAVGVDIKKIESEIQADTETIATLQAELDSMNKELEEANNAMSVLYVAKEQQLEQERNVIKAAIDHEEELIRGYKENTADAVAQIDSKVAALTAELSEINEVIANKALIARQTKRIAELKEQQIHLAAEYAAAEKNLYLAEQFIIAKVNMLNERINQKFKYAKFKLFEKQINGGINEVCEVTYKGIPYKDLNNAARVNIGLDIINTISSYYGVTVPIMIDNAESVNELFHTDAQQIRFYVSKNTQLILEI